MPKGSSRLGITKTVGPGHGRGHLLAGSRPDEVHPIGDPRLLGPDLEPLERRPGAADDQVGGPCGGSMAA